MKSNEVILKCIAEYERLKAVIDGGTKSVDIDFWDHCEELTSAMLDDLNRSLKNSSPSEEFKSIFTKIHELNRISERQVAMRE